MTRKIFISSTSKDLQLYREAARDVVLEVDPDWRPHMMEYFGAQPNPTVQECKKAVGESALVIAIVAFRRGWVPDESEGGNGDDSITALEIKEARARGIDVILMMARDDDSFPNKFYEDTDADRAWVKNYRKRINQPAQFFEYENDSSGPGDRLPGFRAKLMKALSNLKIAPEPVVKAGAAINTLRRGRMIPFIAPGIYGEGPLGRASLGRVMDKGGGNELPTAAEMREVREFGRANFLDYFINLLNERASETKETKKVPDVLKLLAELRETPIIISSCLDNLLEQHLRASGRKFDIIAHILRSFSDDAGKLLIIRHDGKVETSLSQELVLSKDCLTVYKLLGTIEQQIYEPERELDTLVVTESDHVLLLRYLANNETSIPGALIRKVSRIPLLFLGYDLDRWQYRLILQLVQSVGRFREKPIAARKPESPVEDNAWQRLEIGLLQMNADAFAEKANQMGSPA